MKKLYFWFVLVHFLTPEFAFGKIEEDKLQHFGVSAAISGTSAFAMKEAGFTKGEQFTLGLLTAVVVGGLKEATDKKWDHGDFGANVLGAFTGVALVVEFD